MDTVRNSRDIEGHIDVVNGMNNVAVNDVDDDDNSDPDRMVVGLDLCAFSLLVLADRQTMAEILERVAVGYYLIMATLLRILPRAGHQLC